MILVTGASGFVGKEITRRLLELGYQVRGLSRSRPNILHENFEYFRGDITKKETLEGACENVETVIHLVGILIPKWGYSFEKVHVEGTQNIIDETKKSNVRRFIHMSAIGTRANGESTYHQTKYRAEKIVQNSELNWTIFRPSLIYGKNDQITNLFAGFLQYSPFLPMIGDGETILRPIPVKLVAECFIKSIFERQAIRGTFHLCGPALSYRKMLEEIASALDKKAILIPIPFSLAYLAGSLVEIFPFLPLPLSSDAVTMLKESQTETGHEACNLFKIRPPDFREEIRTYLG